MYELGWGDDCGWRVNYGQTSPELELLQNRLLADMTSLGEGERWISKDGLFYYYRVPNGRHFTTFRFYIYRITAGLDGFDMYENMPVSYTPGQPK